MSVKRGAVALLVASLILTAACSKDESKGPLVAASDDDDAPVASTSTTLATVASPLTGLTVSRELAERPVVTVKVDNSPAARPQAAAPARAPWCSVTRCAA